MNRKRLVTKLLVASISLALVFQLLKLGLDRIGSNEYRLLCASNLRELGIALQLYANDCDGQYPLVEKWCDLLVEHAGVKKRHFFCKSAEDGSYFTSNPINEANFPADVIFLKEYNDVGGQHSYMYSVEWCHYAINPNAKPNSSSDYVLLFETKHGWNQFGGPEILTDENHLELEGRKGCHILFNDGSVKFIKPKDLKKLNWGDRN